MKSISCVETLPGGKELVIRLSSSKARLGDMKTIMGILTRTCSSQCRYSIVAVQKLTTDV